MTTPAATTDDHAGQGRRAGSRAQEQHGGDRDEDDPDEVGGPPRQAPGRDEAEEQDGQSDDRHRRDEWREPMAPVEQDQGRPERGELDECESREDRSRQRQIDEPEETPTAMNASATATAVRFRIRRSGSSAGSAPMSRM